jgi:hypothetical protein
MAKRERDAPGPQAAAANAPRRQTAPKEDKRASRLAMLCAVMLAKLAPSGPALFAMADELSRKAVPLLFLVRGAGADEGRMWFEMDCVACGERKPCLPSHFNMNQSEAAFRACPAGREYFHNSASNPCIVCLSRKKKVRRGEDADEWVRSIMHKYKRLRAADTAQYGKEPSGWFWERWRIQGGDFRIVDGKHVITRAARCAITGVDLCLFGVTMKFSASVSNTNVANKGRVNHVSEECEMLLAHRCRCAYLQGLLTIKNGSMRFSVERIDNAVGHIKSNCVIVPPLTKHGSRTDGDTSAVDARFCRCAAKVRRGARKLG